METRRLLCGPLAVVLAMAAAIPARGQFFEKMFNPQVEVNLQHPPGLGLVTSRVAFGPVGGSSECAETLYDAVVSDFVSNGVEVIDRQHLESILAEHKFNFSGYVDQASASNLGQILGAGALVFLKVQRCATDQNRLVQEGRNYQGQKVYTYVARTRAFVKGSIQVVDLATARIFTSKSLDWTAERENKSQEGQPEFPAEFEVLDNAMRLVAGQVHRLFFTWSELRKLYFYDDEECGLETAYNLLRAGDTQGALEQSKTNAETCAQQPKVKPKYITRARYNLAMAQFIVGDYEAALAGFEETLKAGGSGEIVAQSMGECRRAQQLAREMQQVEERAQVEASATPVGSAAKQPGRTGSLQASKPAAPGTGANATVEDRLKRLDAICKAGTLTKEECARKRAEILADL